VARLGWECETATTSPAYGERRVHQQGQRRNRGVSVKQDGAGLTKVSWAGTVTSATLCCAMLCYAVLCCVLCGL
jgi:hypothetical protein